MREYLVESWHWTDPQHREHSECDTWNEACALAHALRAQGDDSAIYRLEASYMGESPELWVYNGVRPGRDFPATLVPSSSETRRRAPRFARHRPSGQACLTRMR